MAGIDVEVRRGKNWWYVVADFHDGQVPVVKGPMTENEAKDMAEELRSGTVEVGATVLDRSKEEARADARVGIAFLATIACVALFAVCLIAAMVMR